MLIDLKRYSLILIFITVAIQGYAQNSPFSVQDSLKKIESTTNQLSVQDSLKKIESTTNQREKAEVYLHLCRYYTFSKGDSALFYLTKAERISKQKNLIDLLPEIYLVMSEIEGKVTGNYPMS